MRPPALLPPQQERRTFVVVSLVMLVLLGWAVVGTQFIGDLKYRLPPSIAGALGWEVPAPGWTCQRLPAFDTNEQRNNLVETWHSTPEFVGGDVGVDVRLSDGRSLWLFGDTLRAESFPPPMMVRNSMLVFDAKHRCGGAVLPEGFGAIIPDRPDGVGYWPTSVGMIAGADADLVAVGLLRVRRTGDGLWDFEVLGPAIARFTVPHGGVPKLTQVVDLGADEVDLTRPLWGAASATKGRWVYLYGTSAPSPEVYGRALQVARVRAERLTDPAKWRYWDGTGWTKAVEDADVLIPAEGGVSQILSVFESDGSWYALSKRDDVYGTDLVVWKAPSPTGPFVAAPAAAHLPSDPEGGVLRYMPLAHPSLEAPAGHVVVSYSRNLTDFDALMKDPYRYRPVFLDVALP